MKYFRLIASLFKSIFNNLASYTTISICYAPFYIEKWSLSLTLLFSFLLTMSNNNLLTLLKWWETSIPIFWECGCCSLHYFLLFASAVIFGACWSLLQQSQLGYLEGGVRLPRWQITRNWDRKRRIDSEGLLVNPNQPWVNLLLYRLQAEGRTKKLRVR